MSKNKLMWSIVLFLIVITSLPIAYAQTFFESPIFFILINSLIVGVILFILQAFLIPKKEPKEQTAVWVAIIVGSLLIGWFFGSQDYIWKHPVLARFFSWYVLVNTLIIGTALYFISGLLDINKRFGGSPEGKGGLGILIFLIAAVFAVQIGNQWIWHQTVVKQLIDYLFGAQGILNPAPPDYRLWAFLAVTTLLSFFFNGFLLKGGAGGTNKVNYALAILIGSSVARAGISFASVVLLGEAIFTIVLADALKGTAPNVKGFGTNWILAGFLVGWASAAMTYGTEYQGWLAWIVGTPLWAMGLIQVGPTGVPARPEGVRWFGWILKMGLGALLIIGLPILLFGFIIGRGKTFQKLRERYKGIRNIILRNIMAGIHKALVTRLPGFRRRFMRLKNVPGREPEIVFRNRLLFMRLLDQELRFDIFYTKYLYMKDFFVLLRNRSEALDKFFYQKELKNLILYLRSQKVKVRFLANRIESGREIEETDELGDDPDRVTPYTEYSGIYFGWNYINKVIVQYMNHLNKFFEQKFTELEAGNTPIDRFDQLIRRMGRTKESEDYPKFRQIIDPSKSRYNSRLENYKQHHEIKAYTLLIWDMFNVSMKGYHPYRFAKNGAEYIHINRNGEIIIGSAGTVDNDSTEVNVYGEFADDVRADRWPRRRLKNLKRDSVPFPPGEDMGKIAEYYLRDWTGFVLRDFRIGEHHPHSRNIQEYLDAWDQGIWTDDDIPWQPKGGKTSPAFDLRVLANPGIYVWWGRERYNDLADLVRDGNPEPHISQYGIKEFIRRLIERTSAQIKEDKLFLSSYPADTGPGVEPQTLEQQKVQPVVDRFEEKGT